MSQFRHIRPGEKLPGLPTGPWNQFLDKLGGHRNLPGADGIDTTSVEIELRNDTASPVNMYGVLAVDSPLVTHANDPGTFLDSDHYVGIAPSADATIAIVRNALTPGDSGRARVLGITPCQVNLTDTSHRFANPTTSTTQLTSGATGIAKILWTDTDFGSTGTQWAVVLLAGGDGNDGGGHAIVTSETTVGGRYPALRLIETGRPSEWQLSENVWLEEINGGTLYFGRKYQFTKFNTDKYIGFKQAGTRECCDAPADDPGVPCGCAIPDLLCLTFSSSEACLDGQQVIFREGRSDYYFNCCGGQNREIIFCGFGVADQWSIGGTRNSTEGADCTYGHCVINITSIEVDCGPPWEATIAGTIEHLDDDFATCSLDGTAFTGTIVEIADDSLCGGAGSGQDGCIDVDCEPSTVPVEIAGTFSQTSGSGGPDGQEVTLPIQDFGNGQGFWWVNGFTQTAQQDPFLIRFECSGGEWLININIDTDHDGAYDLTVEGTITNTSGTTWTISIEDIDTGDGYVFDFNATFDTADC